MRETTLRILGAFLILTLLGGSLAPSGASAADGTARIDINAAGVEALSSLPGIGESYAGRINSYREKNGPFRKIEDLLNVRGIGDATFEKIRDRITVGKR